MPGPTAPSDSTARPRSPAAASQRRASSCGRRARRIRGSGRIAPMRVRDARLALGEIAFTAAPDGQTRFRTTALVDGPFERRPGLGPDAAGQRPLRPRRLRARRGLRRRALPSAAIPEASGSARRGCRSVRSAARCWRMAGSEPSCARRASRDGSAPRRSPWPRAGCASIGSGFAASALSVRLGAPTGVNRLDDRKPRAAASAPRGPAGSFAGLSGDLANVPLLVSAGRGQLANGRRHLTLDGRVTADRQAGARRASARLPARISG